MEWEWGEPEGRREREREREEDGETEGMIRKFEGKKQRHDVSLKEMPAVSVSLITAKQSFNCAPPRGKTQITPDFEMTAW